MQRKRWGAKASLASTAHGRYCTLHAVIEVPIRTFYVGTCTYELRGLDIRKILRSRRIFTPGNGKTGSMANSNFFVNRRDGQARLYSL
ncbi:uncharacterized protein LAJ45_05494 [Morchella importuna]|uniref:uncharacterized protein n=1 Tax=Morchella importuna TaxID=1174673 RepID=UPI001E8D9579|nr:uncharacterized protein LAJ45_05494 [Morchella importuna]KAH8150283.1 hypothetical protein LAJ45_05494 [Morchella importuna]